MKIASGLVIIGKDVTKYKLLLINKDGKWGFTGGFVPEELLNCPEKEFYSRMLGSAIAYHHANTGFNPCRLKTITNNDYLLDYVEHGKIRLIHFLQEISCGIETYVNEIVLPKPRYAKNQLKFFQYHEIVTLALEDKLLPNVPRIVKKLEDKKIFF